MISEKLLQRRFEIDWNRFPAVVFESDDWGACEITRNAEDAAKYADVIQSSFKNGKTAVVFDGTLESTEDLERLYQTLERHRGADGLPPVFTAFTCVGNPDYDAIRANDFADYADIGIDVGVPPGWERGDLAGKWREGVDRGVWAPEFHSNLHHTSPVRLMERLRSDSLEGKAARAIFELNAYYQGVHVPEFEGMSVREQHRWIATGVERFARAVGRPANAAVTSDAYPETEIVWSINGIKTVCLKNSKMNSGEVVVYHTKPWNNQDIYVEIGAYNPALDVVYLTRNVWFENFLRDSSQGPEAVANIVEKRWSENEPAIISTHRGRYASLNAETAEKGVAELEKLLALLSAKKNVRFLSTSEVSDLYRQGWSTRRTAAGTILRKWSDKVDEIVLPGPVSDIHSLTDGNAIPFEVQTTETVVVNVPPGDFLIA